MRRQVGTLTYERHRARYVDFFLPHAINKRVLEKGP